MLTDLLRCEVGGDYGEELVVIAAGEQVDGRVEDVAVIEDFGRLDTQIVDGKHIGTAEVGELAIVGLGGGDNLLGIDDAEIALIVVGGRAVEQLDE